MRGMAVKGFEILQGTRVEEAFRMTEGRVAP
jgi:hypothetical protein